MYSDGWMMDVQAVATFSCPCITGTTALKGLRKLSIGADVYGSGSACTMPDHRDHYMSHIIL